MDMMLETLRFTFLEVLSLIGVVQCVYVIVHVAFRSGDLLRVILPMLYFFVLSVAFLSDFARAYISELIPHYNIINWGVWTAIVPLSVLLIFQMAEITRLPPLSNWTILILLPAALLFSLVVTENFYEECTLLQGGDCPYLMEWLNISGIIAGALSLLTIWFRRDIFEGIVSQKAGKERYWLILSLLVVNTALIAVTAIHSGGFDLDTSAVTIRTILGLCFIYLVSTSMFRIYPSALFVTSRQSDDTLTQEDMDVIKKIDDLLAFEKIYHENGYSRSDLAREVGASENTISRIINIHYKKSFPMLLNEYRVEDAKRLLLDTDESIAIVAQEVGFNSLPSFNRAFKDMEGQSPSSYRRNIIK